jgi:hypothetical protein
MLTHYNVIRGVTAAGFVLAILGGGCSRERSRTGGGVAGSGDAANADSIPAPAPVVAAKPGGPEVFTGSDTLWNAPASLGAPVASFGDEPRWSETTVAAANRGTTGMPTTVIGEVVDVSCYLELGKRGEAHVACATDCVKHGAPIGVVDAENRLYVVMAEEHDPRRYGNVALTEAMLPFMAKTVEVTGMLTNRDGVKTLYVRGYAVGDNPNQPKSEQ